jgi:hypothetical protein
MKCLFAVWKPPWRRQLVATAAMLSLLGSAMAASAAIVPVVNSSFESPPTAVFTPGLITGWTLSNPLDQGVFNPGAFPPAGITATDGVQTAYLNSGNISQTLPALLTANTAYTLQVDVGDRADISFPGYRVRLLAGATLLAEEFSLTPVSGFLTSTVNFTALPGNPALGQPLTIQLVSNGVQVNFDNVRLDATPAPVAPIPLPASLAVWGVGAFGVGLVYRRRKIAT